MEYKKRFSFAILFSLGFVLVTVLLSLSMGIGRDMFEFFSGSSEIDLSSFLFFVGILLMGFLFPYFYQKTNKKKIILLLYSFTALFLFVFGIILPFVFPSASFRCGEEPTFLSWSGGGNPYTCDCIGLKKRGFLGGPKECIGLRTHCYASFLETCEQVAGEENTLQAEKCFDEKANMLYGKSYKGVVSDVRAIHAQEVEYVGSEGNVFCFENEKSTGSCIKDIPQGAVPTITKKTYYTGKVEVDCESI